MPTMVDERDVQSFIDEHMRKLAGRVLDVFEEADEDALASDVLTDVLSAIGMLEAYGVAPGDSK